MRGNPALCYPIPAYPGSIPARAGEPPRTCLLVKTPEVYPRACGGTLNLLDHVDGNQGLSPRVRGNRVGMARPIRRAGSIPARAGEPMLASYVTAGGTVYPRACGGTRSESCYSRLRRGLSLRVRGNPTRRMAGRRSSRSIPARAGEPARTARYAEWRRVYPRACGGTVSEALAVERRDGLSPRVRGNQRFVAVGRFAVRSIPARAGEPPEYNPGDWQCRVYPRACGGTTNCKAGIGEPCGLSPRVRGNPVLCIPGWLCIRSIPARAGEPPGSPHES